MNVETVKLPPGERTGFALHLDPTRSDQTPFQFYEQSPGLPLDDKGLRPEVEFYHYPYLTVEGHYLGTGTYVFYLPDEAVFYLWGDDYMDHWDGMVGPFAGDPTLALPEAASQTAGPPGWGIVEDRCP